MNGKDRYLGDTSCDYKSLIALREHYPWWSIPHLLLVKLSATEPTKENINDEDRVVAMLHPRAAMPMQSIDIERMCRLSEDVIIERFLNRNDYRIVAEEGDAEDISTLENGDDEDMVSEELAEIYRKQGLYDEAIATYRKLSLLNSEKSIYFAGLIAEIEDDRDK